MNQCVPSWDVDDHSAAPPRLPLRPQSNCNSFATDVPTLDYEVAELTWENGQLAMHGLGPPRVSTKVATAASPTKYTWDKPRAGGTLESIINQATLNPQQKAGSGSGEDLAPWFDHYNLPGNGPGSGSANMTMDALVPSSKARNQQEKNSHALQGMRPRTVGCSTRVGSCSGAGTVDCARVARVGMGAAHEGSSMADQSVGASATFGRDSQQVSLDTCERELGVGAFTSTSMDNTSSGKQCTKTTTGDDHDSVSHSRPQRVPDGKEEKKKGSGKSSVSTKRSRAAAIHNQSERKRRDKINQRMKTLQKLVPNSSKTDKASMLDEVIEYLKQLQAQVQMMSRMNMSPMMLPMAMQQQLQMSMMASMGMGMGMGMAGMGVMDMNTIGRPNVSGMPPVFHPTALMPMASWDGTGDRMATPSSVMPDPLSTYLACHSQPMTMDAYSRMAALYHQFQQAPAPTSKN